LRAATISCRDFRGMARGSASELEYQLLLAKDLGLWKPPATTNWPSRPRKIKHMLTALIQKAER